MREDALLNGIFGFFAERVFGPRRRELFEQDLKQVDLEGGKKAVARLEALERSIEQLEARQTRPIRSLEHTNDPHGAMFRKIRDLMSEIENERVNKLGELEALRQYFRKRTLARSTSG